jgi:hypothetical protein
MASNLYEGQLADLHRRDLIADAASAHLRRTVDRDRRRARFAALAAWLLPRLGRPAPIRRPHPAAPTSLNVH